jgi:hypothetical protein
MVNIICWKGPIDNYEPAQGESLHPQVKTDYERTSQKPEAANIQVIFVDKSTIPNIDVPGLAWTGL